MKSSSESYPMASFHTAQEDLTLAMTIELQIETMDYGDYSDFIDHDGSEVKYNFIAMLADQMTY